MERAFVPSVDQYNRISPSVTSPPTGSSLDKNRDKRREQGLQPGSRSSSLGGSVGSPSVAVTAINGYGSPLQPSLGSPTFMTSGDMGLSAMVPHPHPGMYAIPPGYPVQTKIHYFGRDSDLKHHKNRPWFIPVLAVALTIVFMVALYNNNCPEKVDRHKQCFKNFFKKTSFQPLSENPLLGPSAMTLLDLGALESELVTRAGEGWRLFTPMWLHAGVFHLVGNLLGLLLIGIRLEQEFGFLKVGLLYFMTGFAGSLLSALFVHGRISVGASGALMGLLGATFSEIIVNWETYENRTRSLASLSFFVTCTLGYGLMPLMDNFAHFGGAIAGFFLGFVLFIRPHFKWINMQCFPAVIYDADDIPVKSKHTVYQNIFWIISLNLLIAGYVAGLLALFTGIDVDKGCTWCHYMTCMPSNLWKCYGNRHVGCRGVTTKNGHLRIDCQGHHTRDWPSITIWDPSDRKIRALCIKSCL